MSKKLPMRAVPRPAPTTVFKKVRNVLSSGFGIRGSNVELIEPYTVWDDIQGNLVGKRLSSTAGKVDYNYEENTITFSPGGVITKTNDQIAFNLQMLHKKKFGTSIHLHVHWEQPDSTERVFTVRYRVQTQGVAKTTTWTTASGSSNNSTFTYVSGTLNQITEIVEIPVGDYSVSDIVEVQFVRSDTATGNIEVTFVDAHYQSDSLGSAGKYTKWTEQ